MKHAAMLADSEICRMCGGPGSLAHLYWECEATQAARANCTLDLTCLGTMPRSLLLYGIPPAIVAKPEQSLWGEHALIGRTAHTHTRGAGRADAFQLCGATHGTLGQAVGAYLGTAKPPVFPRVGPAWDAPAEPNMFTDGAVTNPRNPVGNTAGAAVVWPRCAGEVTDAERAFVPYSRVGHPLTPASPT